MISVSCLCILIISIDIVNVVPSGNYRISIYENKNYYTRTGREADDWRFSSPSNSEGPTEKGQRS